MHDAHTYPTRLIISIVASLLCNSGCSGAKLVDEPAFNSSLRLQALTLAINLSSDGGGIQAFNKGMDEQCRKRDKAMQKCWDRGYRDVPHLNACMSMFVAGYDNSKNDSDYTFCGTLIGWIDRQSLKEAERGLSGSSSSSKLILPPPSAFPDYYNLQLEALWGEKGVLCIERPRWATLAESASLVAQIPKCIKDPGPAPEPCDPEGDSKANIHCGKRLYQWDKWPNNITVDESQVLFASYAVDTGYPLALNHNATKQRLEPTGALWPLPPVPPPPPPPSRHGRACDPDYQDCTPPPPPPSDTVTRLATAGFFFRSFPLKCETDQNGLCKDKSTIDKSHSQFVALQLWEKRDGNAVTDYNLSPSLVQLPSFDQPGRVIPGTWVHAATLGYLYNPDSPDYQKEDKLLRDATAPLIRLVHKRTGKHFFSTKVPDCNGYTAVETVGRILRTGPADKPSINTVLCNWESQIK